MHMHPVAQGFLTYFRSESIGDSQFDNRDNGEKSHFSARQSLQHPAGYPGKISDAETTTEAHGRQGKNESMESFNSKDVSANGANRLRALFRDPFAILAMILWQKIVISSSAGREVAWCPRKR